MLPLLPANPSTALILVGGFGTRLRPLVNIPFLFFECLILYWTMLTLNCSRPSLFLSRWWSSETDP